MTSLASVALKAGLRFSMVAGAPTCDVFVLAHQTVQFDPHRWELRSISLATQFRDSHYVIQTKAAYVTTDWLP